MKRVERFTNAGFSFEVTDTPAADGGGAGQVAVLLHGFPEDRHSWDRVAPALAAVGHRVLAPDQRGYSPGARPAARSAYTLSQLAGDVLAVADAAGTERFYLVGPRLGRGPGLVHRRSPLPPADLTDCPVGASSAGILARSPPR